MELEIIPFSEVEAVIDEARANWQETDKFNTHAHSHSEIAALVPETEILKHTKPTLYTGLYRHWISLIMDIQGSTDWHVIQLPRFLAREITETYMVWCARGELNKAAVQDLLNQFPKQTIAGAPVESIFTGKEWFLRLDFCSTKDGEGGSAPIQTLEDVIRALCTSGRGTRALLDELEDDHAHKPMIFLVPYNRAMDPHRECRVFCPPPNGDISCISQYRWTSPFGVNALEELEQTASHILQGAKEMHVRIMKHAKALEDDSILKALQQEGFTFDVVLGPTGQILLVEINPFGALSGCGSCLYHWLKDARVLYGQNDKVRVRMAT
ncbi:hypothetical protein PRK78_003592 [Emydomyces testavorans]|uniref:Cell division cycle protein 123 n=1 Tax=Emydomyces testavorans TaxID=2070801 RepID=A0AAF0DGH9_9EURO|nr:hypothetical protein PRK78_003592 [Emydomyces testavorans]